MNLQASIRIPRRPSDGKDGTPGLPGQIPIQKEWVVGDTHRNTDEYVDYIYVRGADKSTSYWYKLASKGTKVDVGAPPSHGTTPSGYERIDWLKELAVKVLIAEESNLAGLILKNEKLISQTGAVGGNSSTDYGNPDFEPNILIDGPNGKFKGIDVEIKGHIEATSGIFKGALSSPFERVRSNYNDSFSNNLIVTPFTFTLPWDQKGSGRLIRLIQPDSGTPSCTAPAGFYFFEDGEQKTVLKMLGAEIIELLGYTDSNGDFVGWLVLNRGLLNTVSTWGEPQRIVAQGRYKTNRAFKYHTFDGSEMTASISEGGKGILITMPEHWFDSADGYYVKVFGNDGVNSAIHTVKNYTSFLFGVFQFSINPDDDNKINLVSNAFDFFFEVHSAARLYAKSGSSGMPGEDW